MRFKCLGETKRLKNQTPFFEILMLKQEKPEVLPEV